jgi:putative oxidoreductase
MSPFERYAPLVGRALLSLVFILSGLGKIAGWSQTAGYMASKGMPLVPFFLVMSILFELGGGLSVLSGFKARVGAVALVLFLIPTTLIFHNFWAYAGMERQMQMANFLKNLAIMGGLTMVAAYGAGPVAVDARKVKG